MLESILIKSHVSPHMLQKISTAISLIFIFRGNWIFRWEIYDRTYTSTEHNGIVTSPADTFFSRNIVRKCEAKNIELLKKWMIFPKLTLLKIRGIEFSRNDVYHISKEYRAYCRKGKSMSWRSLRKKIKLYSSYKALVVKISLKKEG